MCNVLTLLMMMMITTTDSIHCMLMICINNITLDPPNDSWLLLSLPNYAPGTITDQSLDTAINTLYMGEVR